MKARDNIFCDSGNIRGSRRISQQVVRHKSDHSNTEKNLVHYGNVNEISNFDNHNKSHRKFTTHDNTILPAWLMKRFKLFWFVSLYILTPKMKYMLLRNHDETPSRVITRARSCHNLCGFVCSARHLKKV